MSHPQLLVPRGRRTTMFRPSFHSALLALAALAMVGCEASSKLDPFAKKDEPAMLAAYAATAKYPADAQAKDDNRVAVLTRGDDIRLVNFSKDPVRNVNVWINGMFVHKV